CASSPPGTCRRSATSSLGSPRSWGTWPPRSTAERSPLSGFFSPRCDTSNNPGRSDSSKCVNPGRRRAVSTYGAAPFGAVWSGFEGVVVHQGGPVRRFAAVMAVATGVAPVPFTAPAQASTNTHFPKVFISILRGANEVGGGDPNGIAIAAAILDAS